MACRKDDVPVAVLIQEKAKPGVRYRVWGLAKVTDWVDGHFKLQGYDHVGELPASLSVDQTDIAYLAPSHTPAAIAEPYTPLNTEDARRRIDAQIVARQGGAKFRAATMGAFMGRCAISGCDVAAVLEAAHIVPYRGTQTNAGDNALLLRADLHTLFDRQLLLVDPDTLMVTLAGVLAASEYSKFADRPLNVPPGMVAETLGLRLKERAEALRTTHTETDKVNQSDR